jgi:uncharacterized protein (TIGR02265 family)
MSDLPPRSAWFVYDHTVDGLFFKALRGRMTPPVERKLKDLGIDLKGKPKSAPHEQWVKALALAANELFFGTIDDRFRQLGHCVMIHHEETVMGKAVIAVMRLIGPARVLKRINSTLRSGNNYVQATLAPTGPTTWEGVVNECNGNPNYIAGVIQQGLIISGGKNVKVDAVGFDGHSAHFRISWE